MRNQVPFAVVGSNSIIEDENGRKSRGRSYPWGTVNIEERQHCDFQALRTLVLAHHMQDLKDVTSHTHYENYRTGKLTAMMKNGEEEVNALTAVGDEIRSRNAAAKKEGKAETPDDKKELSSTKIVLNKESTEQQQPLEKE